MKSRPQRHRVDLQDPRLLSTGAQNKIERRGRTALAGCVKGTWWMCLPPIFSSVLFSGGYGGVKIKIKILYTRSCRAGVKVKREPKAKGNYCKPA